MGGKLKFGLLILPLAGLTWVVVAIVLGTGSFSGAHATVGPSGPSPSCLPATLEHNATLPGTSVSVSPAPETGTANPYTQVSFLGIPVTDIQNVSVTGSQSGYHYGHVYGYFQGDGGSFVPNEPFKEGERVVVRATLEGPGAGRQIGFAFRVDTPYPTTSVPEFPNPPAPASSIQSFVSAPEVHPPLLTVTVPDRDPAAGDVLTTAGPGPGQYGPLIYTPAGRVVWFDPLSGGLAAEDLNVQSYEGQRALTWWQGRVLSIGFGQGEDLVMNDNYQVLARVKGGNGLQADLHDFQLAPHQVAYATAYNLIRCDLSPEGGPRNGVIVDTAVQEIDIKTGLVRWEWHSLDHVGVSESHAPVPSTQKPLPWDWFHLNSIDLEPAATCSSPGARRGPAIGCSRARGRSSGGSVVRAAASRWVPAPPPHGSMTAACSQTAKSPSSTTARTHASTTSRARCACDSTCPRTAPSSCVSTPTRAR